MSVIPGVLIAVNARYIVDTSSNIKPDCKAASSGMGAQQQSQCLH